MPHPSPFAASEATPSSAARAAPALPTPAWGAVREAGQDWRFRLWAPSAEDVQVSLNHHRLTAEREAGGWWVARGPAEPGTRYGFAVDGALYPDPAARAQAGDVHGPSLLVDPSLWHWKSDWAGRPWDEAVILELHVGTFTREGTFAAAARRLPDLARMGITAVELMPVGQFTGRHGWGYDGVLPYAPHPAYGTPDQMRGFVEAAQELGIMVLLDVVYNHFGPDGAYLHSYAPEFFDGARQTPWGAGIDYTRRPVRDYFIDNALMWLVEYRLDGLRLDAVDQIRDPSRPELLVELAQAVRAAGFPRPIHLTTEDNRNITRLHRPEAGLYTGEWNDDWHHCIHCALTGESEGYYRSFAADPVADLATALADGFVEQGQSRPGADGPAEPRGEPSDHLPWQAFVNFNQNHDQIGNRAMGERLAALAEDPPLKVAHALLLTAPFTPMLFMGEEEGCRAPFLFFADFVGELAEALRKGRAEEFRDFTAFGAEVPDPTEPETLHLSRPYRDSDEPRAGEWRALTTRLLSFRADRIVPLSKSARAGAAVAARTGPRSVRAAWPFTAGRLTVWASFGDGARPPADAGLPADAPDLVVETGAADHGFALWLEITDV
ncbi:malto-oligosyltrehalose trehalohydrolase [Frigidibacter oleivorans]|uniref:malto-oligosyltrehalose trehalohydrolase n=1 Tax=Frigidibacter oleivorans TaxID=2487129 RepID=UPI001F353DF2|nr:malto-oligosyltrehalose trehalohydrolase [Frigidibacter oleivorans]